MRGYRSNEVPLPTVPSELEGQESPGLKLDSTTRVSKMRCVDEARRPPVAVSLGPSVKGVCMPIPDLQNGSTALEGALYRFLRDIPLSKRPNRRFRNFVKMWVRHNLTPLAENADLSFETWINSTPYSDARRQELRDAYQEMMVNGELKTKVKGFLKDEFYLDYKHARCINSRHDQCKIILGPFFQAITDTLFDPEQCPWFIKKVPLPDRAEYIYERIYAATRYYICTDYTSYESSFTRTKQFDCERVLYQEMLRNHPDRHFLMELFDNALIGTNRIDFKWFTVKVQAKRMSGEMNTSLGNGFSNLMFFLYVCKRMRIHDPVGVVEGDDGLFSFDTNVPPEVMVKAMKAEFVALGLDIKIDHYSQLSHASFCGMIFDEEDKTIIGNPLKIMASVGWTTAKYLAARPTIKNMLLRSKALSMAYQYPRCPMITALSRALIRLTVKCDVLTFINKHGGNFLDLYHLDVVKHAARLDKTGQLLFGDVGVRTRILFEDMYGISVNEQLTLEAYFDGLTNLAELDHPLLYNLFPQRWKDFSEEYSDLINHKDFNRDYSTQSHRQLRPFIRAQDIVTQTPRGG
jgi:hypothetical protein